MNTPKQNTESDESYRNRIGEKLPEGAWYSAEDLGDANTEQLDALGKFYGVERRQE